MSKSSPRICTRCVLPENFPGISFDDQGICSYCRAAEKLTPRPEEAARMRERFEELVEELRGRSSYDILVAYSGGKDSSFTLQILKEDYGLRPLALVVDHGFVSETTSRNVVNVCESLDVDLEIFHPGAKTLARLFTRSIDSQVYPAKALERATAVCNSCMHVVKSLVTKTALERDIPMIAYGWSPGQAPLRSSIFKTNATMLRSMQRAAGGYMEKLLGEKPQRFMIGDHLLERPDSRFPYIVHPLAFLDYDEKTILDAMDRMGWVYPQDTGAHSSNCLLNDFAIAEHLERHGFHPYAMEIAGLVREGFMSRKEGLERLSAPPDERTVEMVDVKLDKLLGEEG